jgi:hypothetical protein
MSAMAITIVYYKWKVITKPITNNSNNINDGNESQYERK